MYNSTHICSNAVFVIMHGTQDEEERQELFRDLFLDIKLLRYIFAFNTDSTTQGEKTRIWGMVLRHFEKMAVFWRDK